MHAHRHVLKTNHAVHRDGPDAWLNEITFTFIDSPVSPLLSNSSPILKVESFTRSPTVVFSVHELPLLETSKAGLLFFATSRRFSGTPKIQCIIIWVPSREDLTLLHARNKGADQPAHPRSLISVFFRSLQSILYRISLF